MLLLGLLLGTELSARLFWSLRFDMSFLHPDLFEAFYLEPDYLRNQSVRSDDEFFDVLLLGGSVVNPSWGLVQPILFEEMTYRLNEDLRIYNLSAGGHTTRDSLLKYKRMERHRFDLVLVYHGINDTRANNCPAEVFKADYSHFSWYAAIEALRSRKESALWVTPYTLIGLWMAAQERLGFDRYLSRDVPDEEWVRFGGELKSTKSFQANVQAIVDHATGRGEPIILMTFAYHVPENYEEGEFYERGLDYVRHGSPIELWGEPEYVVAGIEAHNAVIRKLAATEGVPLIDLATEVPRRGDHFNDICHLSYKGASLFAKLVVDEIARIGLAMSPVRRRPVE